MTIDMTQAIDSADEALRELADAYGISTGYWSFYGQRVEVAADTLVALLGAMGVHVRSAADARAALAVRHDAPWRELLPPSCVVREGTGEIVVHTVGGSTVRLTIVLEDGTRHPLALPEQPTAERIVDGRTIHRLIASLPGDLPLGWHEVQASEEPPESAGSVARTATCVLAVTPARLPAPPSRPRNAGRSWGIMAQLYSVRSRHSWGIGDFADLADLAAITGARGADFVLINPIHAAEVTTPMEPSPYLPASRRFISPVYIRPDDIAETSLLSADQRARFAQLRREAGRSNADAIRLDRDTMWTAKKAALEIVHDVPRSPARQAAFDAFVDSHGQPLADFALWCALSEDGSDLPGIHSARAKRQRDLLADRIRFYSWLQWIADEQLAASQEAARRSGMRIGIMADLAVGVHPLGSDVWSRPDLYGAAASVGAPPDMYNQQGQDWSQPPWLPESLARAAYAPLRDLLRTALHHVGALRIDHIMGLFRLWWIPAGESPDTGTYVRYDHEAMIGVLALEALRAGASIIGEDLGNVEPWVRDHLADRGILGTSVLWFENGEHGPIPPEAHRDQALETITTHDLPPTAGYLAGEHVRLRAQLGLLERPVDEEYAAARRERDAMTAILRERQLIGPDPTEEELVIALHLYAAASPARLLGVALVDAVGERRAQNQPGTHREYPNWQVPLAGPDQQAVLVDDLAGNERFGRLLRAVDHALQPTGPGTDD